MLPEQQPTREAIAQRQWTALQELLRAVLPANPFHRAKFAAAAVPGELATLEEFLSRVPFTTKTEISSDQAAHPPYGSNLTFALDRYTRCHQTSGTHGAPLRWLDTPESWDWMLANWQTIYRAAGVTRADSVFFAFSFGPFIGFWLAFEAAVKLGCRCIPGGGMSTKARLAAILDHRATVLCCTPTYALHLAETAAREGIDLSASRVKTLIVAGEPGGCIPSVRARLESLWPGARVQDHHGMTEVGPVTYECPARPCVLHVMESAYLAEIIDPATGMQLPRGATGELVLTTLGRTGSPLIRYRTGDQVRTAPATQCACGSHELALEGGILGRIDDMLCVRGVNVYPSAIEEILRAHGGIGEYQVRIRREGALIELAIHAEPSATAASTEVFTASVEQALHTALNLRIPVTAVASGSLPRFEMKARRWIKESP